MPTIKPPERHRSFWKQLFGQSEKDNFVEGIKNRREGTDKAEASDYFFDPVTTEVTAPMAMMTKYIKNGVPDIAERITATEGFKKATGALGERAAAAGESFARRYPRIAAHMGIKELGRDAQMSGVVDLDRMANPRQFDVGLKRTRDIGDTIAHEGTHVAQALGSGGLKNMKSLYNAASDAIENQGGLMAKARGWSYTYNPWEKSAVRSAARVAQKEAGVKPERAISATREMADLIAREPEKSKSRVIYNSIKKSRSK